METWFLLAVGAAITGGIPSFMMKMAAVREYHSETFLLYSALISVVIIGPTALILSGFEQLSWLLFLIAGGGGVLAAVGGVFRIQALRYIDTTIYYPLVKLLSPALAIVAGIIFWQESFTTYEWIGLIASLFVPLMLISKFEKTRQNNLVAGLFLVLITGLISVIIIMINKLSVDWFPAVLWILFSSSFGVFVGSIGMMAWRNGPRKVWHTIQTKSSSGLVSLSLLRGLFITLSFGLTLYAFSFDGPLAVVHTIHSLYILIPIVLSIIFYGEHWNIRKATAIILSVAALALLG